MLTLYVSADNTIRIKSDDVAGLLAASDGSSITDATVTFTLKDSDNATVSGASAISMTYSATTEYYQGTLESTVSLTAEAIYYLEITATSGTKNGFWRTECRAAYQS